MKKQNNTWFYFVLVFVIGMAAGSIALAHTPSTTHFPPAPLSR